jgi:hypothetical protein
VGSGTMAARNAGVLKRSALAWALRQSLRFAVATCIVALVLATTLSGAGAERFATTAYIAAIVAAVSLAGMRFFPATEIPPRSAIPQPPFPIFLGYAAGVIAGLSIVAALVAQAGAEALVLVAAFGLIVLAVLVRSGRVGAFAAALSAGGVLAATSRYAVLVAVCALTFAALTGSAGEGAVLFGYRLAIVAALAIAISLLAPTRAGTVALRSYRRLIRRLDALARRLVFQRSASNAAIVAVASIAVASLLPPPFSEPFAIVAYAAASIAALNVALECRRTRRTCRSGR